MSACSVHRFVNGCALTLGTCISSASLLPAQATRAPNQPIDSAYTAQILALTPKDPRYTSLTDLVDHLPASLTVPTPLKMLGYVPGTIGRLSYVADMNRYFRALAKASPRVKVFSLGSSDEGREMIVVAIADDTTITKLDDYRHALARLGDPRGVSMQEREKLLGDAKPIYWLSGSIHSPETGSSEMLMELAYRLAVDESPYIRGIRSHVITLITPAMEVDGRDRMVDVVKLSYKLKLPIDDVLDISRDVNPGPSGIPLIYWGRYTAHDNNRDAMIQSQQLTRNFMKGFLYWRPTVVHDLHESVAFLYASTGTGPYNDAFDPLVISEWNTLAQQEIAELTRRGLPGVWTHGYYDGWAPNYTLLAIANLHNSIGRFYETYSAFGADCGVSHLTVRERAKRWDRPDPPLNGVRWCIRSNINYQETGALVALRYVADNDRTFLENYVTKAARTIRRGRTTTPYAYVIPRNQRHAAEAAGIVNLFRAQAVEVQEADADFSLPAATPSDNSPDTATTHVIPAAMPAIAVHRGDWIVRLDQPEAAPARTMLALQHYKIDDPTPYDDAGWTVYALRHVDAIAVGDSSVFGKPMHLLTTDAVITGTVAGSGSTLLVRPLGDWRSAVIPWRVAPARVVVADTAFTVGGARYPAGTFLISGVTSAARGTIASLGVDAVASDVTKISTHPITLPRIALVHTWIATQDEGWVRYALDRMRIPYTYISDQVLRKPNALDQFDVVLFPHVQAVGTSLLNGRPIVGPPIPWKTTALTPNIGKLDHTDDMRGGMGLDGAAALKHFVERGGLLITEGATSQLVAELGFSRTVSAMPLSQVRSRGGSVYRARIVNRASPVLYGYDHSEFPVYFKQAPLLNVEPYDTLDYAGPLDSATIAQTNRMHARVLLAFQSNPDSLVISGLLSAGNEPMGRPAIVDAPVGRGHAIMFAIRPMWRWETQGTFALVINAIANWNALSTADPAVRTSPSLQRPETPASPYRANRRSF